MKEHYMRKIVAIAILATITSPSYAQISPSQLQQLKMTLDQLDAGDTDKDGFTTIDEVKVVRSREFATLSAGKGEIDPETLPTPPQVRAMMLKNMDKDGNGRLSEAEFVNGLPPVWGRLDQDGDNRISRQEISDGRLMLEGMGG
jgi:hypothetical protein